jgi:hypothetical protein
VQALEASIVGILLVAAVPRGTASDKQGLFVPLDAVDVVRRAGKGRASIEYHVKEPYPASETLAFVQSSLSKRGWRPATGAELARHESSSLVSGWTDLPGLRGSTLGRLWSARWLDARGNQVVYSLASSSPLMEAGLEPVYVSVAGWYYSRKEAARYRKELDELAKSVPSRFRVRVPPPLPAQPCPWE